jgi:hypothetical protein
MAKTRLCMATIVYGNVDPIPYVSHLNAFYRLGKDMDIDLIFHGPYRMPIATARNDAVRVALNSDCDWIFFYDNDMVLTPSVVKHLMEHDVPAVMANCLIRGYPYAPMMFRWDANFLPEKKLNKYQPTPEEYEQKLLLPMEAIGTPCTLIRMDVFKAMTPPYFLTGDHHTEDVFFCMKAYEQVEGFKCYADLSIECGHMLDPFVLVPGNAAAIRAFNDQGYDNSGLPNKDWDKVSPKKVIANPIEEIA